jgi:hypothetical protein
MAAPGVRIPVRRKLVYATVLALLVLLACEGILRARAWIRYGTASNAVRDPMLTFDPAAGIYVPIPGYEVKGATIHIKINSLGFRGPEFSREKPPNTFRIVCLGASTTFSSEASSNAAIWTQRLQDKLQAAYPDTRIEVINAAVGGYVASDNLKNLTHRVLPLDPDVVIYYEANNEIVKDTQELAASRGLLGPNGRRQSAFVSQMSRFSLTFDLAYKNLVILMRSRTQAQGAIDRVPPELPARFIGVLDDMRSALAARGVPLVVSTFIVKYRRDQPRPTQIANADVAFYYMPWMSIEGMLDAMDVYNTAIVDYGRRKGLPVVDDRNVIPADADHFADCMHLTDMGNEMMAERFFRFIQAADGTLGPARIGRAN